MNDILSILIYYVNTAVNGMEDNSKLVTKLDSLSQISAETLNANRTAIQHTDEWREWINGPDGYPILKFELDEKGFIK